MKRFEIIDKKTNEALCNLGYEDKTMTVADFESHIRKECALGPDVQIALFTAVNELNQNGSLKALVAHALMRDHLPYDGKIYMDYPITKDEAEQKKESSQFLIQNNLVEGHGKNNNIISKDLEKEEGIIASITNNNTRDHGKMVNAITDTSNMEWASIFA